MLMIRCTDDVHRRYRALAVSHGLTNDGLLTRLLDAEEARIEQENARANERRVETPPVST
ncbi:hypothetical protein WME75_10645 [Sorangium sp. So ce1014]|uniref:ribbon-helix-helix protein n=1 Tax=Sorangium sp. So ce1014 TaxID=3133326 RepID=UPI003F5D93D9